MSVRELIDLMDWILPCPPNPMPEPNSDADYLWRATLFNAGRERPFHIVEMMPRHITLPPINLSGSVSDSVVHIIRVECNERGKGVRVLR